MINNIIDTHMKTLLSEKRMIIGTNRNKGNMDTKESDNQVLDDDVEM